MDSDRPTPARESNEHRIVGARLREAREVLGLTQEDVAGALGIPRTSVIAMEAGRRKVTGLELRRLGRLFRRPIDWLLGESDSPVHDVEALHRATAALSEEDKEQVLRFAQFLASAGSPEPRGAGVPRPRNQQSKRNV
ncbi:MAG: helix-turn-helix domain-containing protein [Candidatus Limnocylindrales bacterium]